MLQLSGIKSLNKASLIVSRGVDAIVTVAPVLGERGGAPVGVVGAAGVSLLYWRRRSGPSE
jgi:hypothetical protein